MYLRNIKIFMNQDVNDKIYCSHFDFHVFFIGFYLSQQLKKIKFVTDGTFDTINIRIGTLSTYVELGNKTLTVNLPFDYEFYNNADESLRCEYYFKLLKKAFEKASDNKNIPFVELMDSLTSLAKKDFIYSWTFKNVIVPEYNLKIKLISQLSTNDYILKIFAYDENRSSAICEGQVLRTKPDDIFFSYLSNKIQVENGRIVILSKWDTKILSIELKDLLKGVVAVDFFPTPYPDDKRATEIYNQLIKELKYDNNDFS